MEREILQTQTVMTTRLNKRLREETEEEDENSQSTQSSQESQSNLTAYNPDSDSSEDNDDILEPIWIIDGNNLSKNLAGFRSLCYRKNLFEEDSLYELFDYICYRHFTSLEGKANFKPDMKFYTTIDGIQFGCLLIEVKCPNSACGEDLFKLSIEM